MVIRTLAIDSGKYATKAVISRGNGELERLKFRTKISNAEKLIEDNGQSFTVRFEGHTYLLGKQATNWDVTTSKKTEIHKIATYTAIALLVGNGDGVNVGIGCPLSTYLNKEARIAYKDYILPRGKQITISVDGKTTTFVIRQSYVFPESSGVIYLHDDKYMSEMVGVIDIGGMNANCCKYTDLAPTADVDSMFTLNAGSNILLPRIKEKLQVECDTELDDGLMEKVMAKGELHSDPEKSKRIISEMKKEHIESILNECKKHKWSVKDMQVVFTGGTAIYLKDEIERTFPYIDVDNLVDGGDFANAEGFLKQTLARCGL